MSRKNTNFMPGLVDYDLLRVETVTLEPGDFLYVPSWWWHSIEHVEDPPEFVIGVGLRPIASAIWQYIPGVWQNWQMSLGILPGALHIGWTWLWGGDWGKDFYHQEVADNHDS